MIGAKYLVDLADVLRAAGLVVHEVDGWQSRARGSGGYDVGRPTTLMCHHTASNTSVDNDVSYICFGADAAPLANLYLPRTGEVYVCAAGATNTNGSGHDWWGGGVPDDSMNTHAIGIEAANDGVGEPWPFTQQQVYVIMCRALGAAYGIDTHHTRSHFEWTDRKIDVAGESSWAHGSASWDMDAFRADVGAPEPEPPGDDTVIRIFASHEDPPEFNAVFFAECDAQGRSIELQWSGDGDDPRVAKRLKTMQENFGDGPGIYGSWPLLLVGVVNNRLHPKHKPADIRDSKHTWIDEDFAP